MAGLIRSLNEQISDHRIGSNRSDVQSMTKQALKRPTPSTFGPERKKYLKEVHSGYFTICNY